MRIRFTRVAGPLKHFESPEIFRSVENISAVLLVAKIATGAGTRTGFSSRPSRHRGASHSGASTSRTHMRSRRSSASRGLPLRTAHNPLPLGRTVSPEPCEFERPGPQPRNAMGRDGVCSRLDDRFIGSSTPLPRHRPRPHPSAPASLVGMKELSPNGGWRLFRAYATAAHPADETIPRDVA